MALSTCFRRFTKLRYSSKSEKTDSVVHVEEVHVPKPVPVDHKEQNSEKTPSQNVLSAAEEIAHEIKISDEDVQRAVTGFVQQLTQGLRESGSAIEQLPSFINELPCGREEGTCLAVDLGGTNLRVCSVTLNADGTYSLVQKKTAIPHKLMTCSSAHELFVWVARLIETFLNEQNLTSSKCASGDHPSNFNLGFTFSHAVEQTGINSGTLVRWSKGFDIEEAVGQDICALLQNALEAINVPVRVTALINDTVGTLLTAAYTSKGQNKPVLGAVFGTGTNGAYVEQGYKVSKLGELHNLENSIMIMNTEWGNFDPNLEYLPQTRLDKMLDLASVNPGLEMFEKRISGMYLGELLRLAVLDLLENGHLNRANFPAESGLFKASSLDSSIISLLESDDDCELCRSRTQIEHWLGVDTVNLETTMAMKVIAKAIGQRSAKLSAAAIGAVVIQTESLGENAGDKVDIGVDGSLVELYPQFLAEVKRTLKIISGVGDLGGAKLNIRVVKDGSAAGAALAALLAAK